LDKEDELRADIIKARQEARAYAEKLRSEFSLHVLK